MDAHHQKTASTRHPLEEWIGYRTIFPRFYDLLVPIGTDTPSILDVYEVRQALCAVLLVNIDAFRYTAPDIPVLSDDRVFLLWDKAYHFWHRRRRAAYRIVRLEADQKKTTYGLWPLLIVGLRSLDCAFPRISEGEFLRPELQRRFRRNPRVWAYLSTVAHLLEMLRTTRKAKD